MSSVPWSIACRPVDRVIGRSFEQDTISSASDDRRRWAEKLEAVLFDYAELLGGLPMRERWSPPASVGQTQPLEAPQAVRVPALL
jgi:hypothetical protein